MAYEEVGVSVSVLLDDFLRERQSGETSNAVNRSKKTQDGSCGMMEVILPDIKDLQAIQHGSIMVSGWASASRVTLHSPVISCCRGCKEQGDCHAIELPKPWIFIPYHPMQVRCFGDCDLSLHTMHWLHN